MQVSSAPKVFTYWQSWDFDAEGHIHMCYRNWDSGNQRIYYATNRSGAWVQTSVTDGDGNALVITPDQVVHLFNLDYDDNIYERTKPVSGGAWSAAQQVASSPAKGFIQDVVVDSSGGIYFCWGHLFDSSLNPPSAAYGRYKPLGGSWGPTEFIQGVTNDIWPQNLNMAVRGTDILAAYRLTNTSSGARYKVRDGQTGLWSAEKTVAPGQAYGGVIAVSPTGELAMAWGQPAAAPQSGTHWQIWVSFSEDAGATWSEPYLVHGEPDLNRSPFTTYDAKGNFHIAWEGRTSESGKFKTYYRERIGGLWQPEEIVVSPGNANPHGIKVNNNTLYITYNTSSGVVDGTTQVFLKSRPLPTDNSAPSPVSSLTATPGERSLMLSWQNPPDADFAGTRIVMSTSTYPTGPFTNSVLTTRAAAPGSIDSFTVYPLVAGVPCYFSLFAQDSSGNWSLATHGSATPDPDTHPPANPTSFTAEAYTTGNIQLTWHNPPDADFGGTMIRYKTTGYPTGPADGLLVANRAASPGSIDSVIQTGLTPGVTYYYSAFAYDQQPAYSSGAHAAGTPGSMRCIDAKLKPDGAAADLRGKVVTAAFPSDGAIYISEPDGSSAIRVLTTTSVSPGQRVDVTGQVQTRVLSGQPSERQIASATVTALSAGSELPPINMNTLEVGGEAVGALLPGVIGGVGLNNMGLLVRVTGRVTTKISSSFWLDDGGGVVDPLGQAGILVKCPDIHAPVIPGDIVSVTGVIEGSISGPGQTNRRQLHIRSYADIANPLETP